MLLRDRLQARLAGMGERPDYQKLAADVLGIRNAPPELARRLVSQALVIEDRRETWERIGERIGAAAPAVPGVYVLRAADGAAVYVGKANNLRRRLRAHFSSRRWRLLKAGFARAVDADWQEVGSELEALLCEARWIRELRPAVNVQTGDPRLESRGVPRSIVRDVVVLVPSVEADSVELVAARVDGAVLVQRTRRSGDDLAVHAARLMRFFNSPLRDRFDASVLAPIVFSWLAGRGASASRLDPRSVATPRELRRQLATLLSDERLFSERIVVLHSKVRASAGAPERRSKSAARPARP